MVKVMVIDGGARGHAIALAHLESNDVDNVVVAPGNDGMVNGPLSIYDPGVVEVDDTVKLNDVASILNSARAHKPDLIEVAQDDALAGGAVDKLEREGYRVFGPSKDAAQIEWDKAWARRFMTRHGILTPEYEIFERGDGGSLRVGLDMVRRYGGVFVKASGLCGGKGAIYVDKVEKIGQVIDEMSSFGDASKIFLIESAMKGEEFSYYAIVDGQDFKCFNSAQDNQQWHQQHLL